jgi:hypothetical protein
MNEAYCPIISSRAYSRPELFGELEQLLRGADGNPVGGEQQVKKVCQIAQDSRPVTGMKMLSDL